MTRSACAAIGAIFVLSMAPGAAWAQGYSQDDRSFDIKGAAIVSVQRFSAIDTFQGIFGSATGVFYGGGIDLRIQRHLFVRLDVTRFKKTGQRAFDLNGQVFRLNIPLDVSIVPVTGTVGYRARASRNVAWYLGAGAGSWSYNESGQDPSDSVSARGTGYLGLAGVEWQLHRFVALGLEGQFASVPNVIGKAGLSADLKEKDLGGITGAFRVVVGR